MTIAQNVLAGLRLAGIKVDNKDALVQECLSRAGLWNEARFRLNQSARRFRVASSSACALPGPRRQAEVC